MLYTDPGLDYTLYPSIKRVPKNLAAHLFPPQEGLKVDDIISSNDLFGDKKSNRGAEEEFLIVGIGASAGGIQALKEFFSNVPVDSGMAYVVILHRSPDHESHLAEVLQVTAAIPVIQVRDRVRVEPNNVYVISPNRSLALAEGHLSQSEMTSLEERRAPVDIFFRTLAESHHARAVSVILSGTGADGSMGIKRIKENGGICIVQDPDEAEYDDMPRNSIATGLVDYTLPVAEIPAKIIAYKNHLAEINIQSESQLGTRSDDQALRDIFTHLRVRTGHDFTNYKRSTVIRRIERRISIHQFPDVPNYARFLRQQPDEARALLRDLLISVTNFFRDREAFEALEKEIIPKLFENKGAEEQVRVWVAGCATGEEAYSIAMLLSEFIGEHANMPTAQVFATDIDEWAISKAREGYYTVSDTADVSPERLRTFFVTEGEGYRVRRELREMVLFACHNLIKDPPFSHLDIISCRNLLIYLNSGAQERVMEVLHFALTPGRYLFLGTSESIAGSRDLFTPFDKEKHIYQSRPIEPRLQLPIPNLTVPAASRSFGGEARNHFQEVRAVERLTYLDLHQRLLEQYAPPSVIINEDYEIVHLSDRAGRYLQIPGGDSSHNLLKVILPELRLKLRTALHQSTQKMMNVELRGVRVHVDNTVENINLIVRPVLREEDMAHGFILVIFDETQKDGSENVPLEKLVGASEPIARQLEEELGQVKTHSRATTEQFELQQEELKASNEELQAMNEELRSSAQELETSKEELQSVNEELTTVNQELKIKIEELSQANNDFQNLMNSTDIGTIFLDRSMHIKLFTPRAQKVFNLIPADLGRSLGNISSKLDYAELLRDVERVFETLQTIEHRVSTADGAWYLMRLLPYRTDEDRVNGVVMTFTEITAIKRVEESLRTAREELELRVEERTRALAEANESLRREIRDRNRSEEMRFELLRKLVRAQEDERQRIARDLHDELGQQLTALRLKLETLKGLVVDREKLVSEIEYLQGLVGDIESDVDFLAWETRPMTLDDLGLPAALNDQVERWSKHVAIPIEIHTGGLDSDERLSPEIETNLYRISQEALNNIYKHAAADQITLILERRDDDIVLIIEDNGRGFDPQRLDETSNGLGLAGIRERAALVGGTVEIESEPNKGTTLFVRVPARFVDMDDL